MVSDQILHWTVCCSHYHEQGGLLTVKAEVEVAISTSAGWVPDSADRSALRSRIIEPTIHVHCSTDTVISLVEESAAFVPHFGKGIEGLGIVKFHQISFLHYGIFDALGDHYDLDKVSI